MKTTNAEVFKAMTLFLEVGKQFWIDGKCTTQARSVASFFFLILPSKFENFSFAEVVKQLQEKMRIELMS